MQLYISALPPAPPTEHPPLIWVRKYTGSAPKMCNSTRRCIHYYLAAIYMLVVFFVPTTVERTNDFVSMPKMLSEDVKALVDQAQEDMNEQFHNIYQRGVDLARGSPAWFMSISHSMRPIAKNMSDSALIVEEATRYVVDQYKLSHHQIVHGLAAMDMSATRIGRECPTAKDMPCQPRKYRAFSGYCNNVLNPHWGTANVAYNRWLAADYADGVSLPRGGGIADTEMLPSPREVSLQAHVSPAAGADHPHRHLMAGAAIWGEFLAHDIAHTPQMAGHNGNRLRCCGVIFEDFHPECFPIRLPVDDPVYSRKREKCQEFVRSSTAPRTDCTMGPREQINQATSFIDASMIYGASRVLSNHLRLFQGGLLKTQDGFSSPIMPTLKDENFCRFNDTKNGCFLSGDVRANENVGLVVMYTLWLREHNRIAAELQDLNPHWSDETLFQETRKIIIASLQHLTYNEYLPIVLGQKTVEKYGIALQRFGYYNGYNVNVNPTVANTVATAALAFVTSLMPDVLSVINQAGQKVGEQSLLGSFYAPFAIYEYGGLDRVLQGMLHGSARDADPRLNHLMTNAMFKDRNYDGNGLDLAAQIIQRGRDHGIPSYTVWRQYCGLPKVQTFTDLEDHMPQSIVEGLQKVYKGVSDIDLFTGGLSETALDGGLVGPTFACLLGEQFEKLRAGDRHWYENNLPPSHFTPDQLTEIRKQSLSKIVCANSEFIQQVQSRIFIGTDDFLNSMLHCEEHMASRIDLTKWKEVRQEINLDRHLLEAAIHEAKQDVEKMMNMEVSLKQRSADPRSPVGAAFSFNRPKRQATAIANSSLIYQFASQRFVNEFLKIQYQDQETSVTNFDLEEIKKLMQLLPNINIAEVIDLESGESVCDDPEGPCDHTVRYRTITGRCNNLLSADRGQALKPFRRLLQPAYDDGIGSPRQTSVRGGPLPSARLISATMHPDSTFPHVRYSLMLMQFAQILDHDMTHTPVNKGHIGRGILDCTPCDAALTVHPDCIPIPVPEHDAFFPLHQNGRANCIPVTRSLPGRLSLGYREQMSQVTAYLDASFIYGSDRCEAEVLREFSGGRLNATVTPGRKALLPQISSHPECRSRNGICFRAGDARASEQPGLTSLHTMFLREHNRIAGSLGRMNVHWKDEKIYQESRRILSSIVQHIAFSEFLPRVFGWNGIEKFGLSLNQEGYFQDYDSECDATILNEFAAAAYRFGHSLLKPKFIRMNNKFEILEPPVRLRDHFFNPELLYQEGLIDEILRGIIVTPMETLDPFITKEVTNHLFEDLSKPFSGMDLAAINVQRARDHGVPSYNNYRHYCNLTRANTFEDLGNTIPEHLVKGLQGIYAHVDDIDLFPGGLLETPLKGGVIGPTFACIIGDQFRRLRKCDRFWYENDDPFTRFTTPQLHEIKKFTLAKLLCNNMDSIAYLQRYVMDLPDPFLNPKTDCAAIPNIDFIHWKDRKSCAVDQATIDRGMIENVSPCVICTCTKEGPLCKSQKVRNCFKIINKHSWSKVMNDPVCRVQCAFISRFSNSNQLT